MLQKKIGKIHFVFITAAILLLPHVGYSDIVVTTDGMVLNGKIIEDMTNDHIVLGNDHGVFRIHYTQIKDMHKTHSYREDVKILKKMGKSVSETDIKTNFKAGIDKLEARKLEAKKLEAKKLEAEKLEAKKLEAEKLEAKKLEAKKLEAKKLEAQKLEAEKLEAKKLEAKKLKAKKLEAKKNKVEMIEAKKLEAEMLEVKIFGIKKLEAQKLEAKKLEAKKLEAKKLEAEKIEAKKLEAKKLEAKKLEAKKLEAKKLEARKLEAKKLKAKKLEAKKLEDRQYEARKIKTGSIGHLLFVSPFVVANIGKIQSGLPFSIGASLTGDIQIASRYKYAPGWFRIELQYYHSENGINRISAPRFSLGAVWKYPLETRGISSNLILSPTFGAGHYAVRGKYKGATGFKWNIAVTSGLEFFFSSWVFTPQIRFECIHNGARPIFGIGINIGAGYLFNLKPPVNSN